MKKNLNNDIQLILDSAQYYPDWNAFDINNHEPMLVYLKKLSHAQRKKVYHNLPKTKKTYIDYINEHWQFDKEILWSEILKNQTEKNKKEFILEYNNALEFMKEKNKYNESYDWEKFTCILEENNETSKLQMIKKNWSELGNQVYCHTNKKLCPCLKTNTDGSTYKCFREYLQKNKLHPESNIPFNLRIE